MASPKKRQFPSLKMASIFETAVCQSIHTMIKSIDKMSTILNDFHVIWFLCNAQTEVFFILAHGINRAVHPHWNPKTQHPLPSLHPSPLKKRRTEKQCTNNCLCILCVCIIYIYHINMWLIFLLVCLFKMCVFFVVLIFHFYFCSINKFAGNINIFI